MKKIVSSLSILLLTFFLAACGSTTETLEQGQTSGESVSTTSPSQDLEGQLVASDSQSYTITVVDGFELTAEEPNSDILFNKEHDTQSMRIETFNSNDANIEEVSANLEEILKASNENGTLQEITDKNLLPTGESIENVTGHQIDTPDGQVSGFTFERKGLIIKLTIFDTIDKPALETFVNMAETIKKK